jgi:hypothetical protein
MATKDWKKRKYLSLYAIQFQPENEIGLWRKETSSTLYTLTITTFEPKSIEVLVTADGGLKVLVRKYFTSKSAAIKFAKDYMKNH